MDVAELVLKYIEALVWPAVVLVLAWSFRRHLKRAFGRMTRLETPAGAIEFAEDAARTYEEVEVSGTIQASVEGAVYGGTLMHSAVGHTRERDAAINQALELIATSPDSAVMIAWRAVEMALRKATPQLPRDVQSPRVYNTSTTIMALRQHGLLAPHIADTAMNLSRLRARVSHGQHTVLPEAAFDFVASCELVLERLEAIANLPPAA
ncbi:hypothetical protein [Streptomyces sp. NRRL S-241]|uniref:hypothetical protein n=1 Tax=Streptomyces sp. NRRL S-241 TaxID=1463896 RepID=UPI00131CC958|nr:hypothetical protein [Streptomyces sp. NRRL S-241]